MEKRDVNIYRGEYISDVPKVSGIYAWYFSPNIFNLNSSSDVFAQIARQSEVGYELSLNLRYGMRAKSKGVTNVSVSGRSVNDVLSENMPIAGNFLESLVESGDMPMFTRPLYIGIAKNLYERVFKQHYRKVTDYWDPRSNVSIYLENNSDYSVQDVIDNTLESHSFALESRVRKIPARDLIVVVHKIPDLKAVDIGDDKEVEEDDSEQRRALEKVLHYLTDPICGRK
jgi:hypothetical protein